MATYNVLFANFQSGEIPVMMRGNTQSQRYLSGLSTVENFISLLGGGGYKRTGTRFVGFADSVPHLVSFDMGGGERPELEWTAGKLRAWTSQGARYACNEIPVEITTDYDEESIPELVFAVNKGILYVVHHRYPPRRLVKDSTNGLALETIEFVDDPKATNRTFSQAGDYPSCQTFRGGRWILASTDNEPTSVFQSRTPDLVTGDRFNDFSFRTNISQEEDADANPNWQLDSSHAILFDDTDMYGSRIQWLLSQQRLIAGAGRSIWMDDGNIASPETFDLCMTLSSGCYGTRAKALDNCLLFLGPGGKSLHTIIYSDTTAGYQNIDISATAVDMLKSGIKDFAIMESPEPMIWVVTNDGLLCSCLFDFAAGIYGWSRHPMGIGPDGQSMPVLAIDIVPGDSRETDTIWLAIHRNGKVYIETLQLPFATDVDDAIMMDCYSVLKNRHTPTIDVPYLTGFTVDAVSSGAALPRTVVNGDGQVIYDRKVGDIAIGLPIATKIQLLRPELPANGSSLGNRIQIQRCTLKLFSSLGGAIGSDLANLTTLLYLRPGAYSFGSPLPLFSGIKTVDIPSFVDSDLCLWVVSDDPFPLCLVAIAIKFSIMEA